MDISLMDSPVSSSIPPISPMDPPVPPPMPTTYLIPYEHISSQTLTKGDVDVVITGSKEGVGSKRVSYDVLVKVKKEPFKDPADQT